MWHDGGPGTDIVPQIDYSTDYYSELAIDRIQGRDRSRPFYMYLACEPSNCLPHHASSDTIPLLLRTDQAVHGPFQEPPESEQVQTGGRHPWSTQVFASSKLHDIVPRLLAVSLTQRASAMMGHIRAVSTPFLHPVSYVYSSLALTQRASAMLQCSTQWTRASRT